MTIKHSRYGNYGGTVCLFTHRDPKSGQVWSDDIPITDDNGKVVEWGKWVEPASVTWLS